MKGTSLECPQCGAEHCGGNGAENIRKNNYIISYLKKEADKVPEKKDKPMEIKRECQKHGKEENLFCQESGCQMPICISCLKDEHKGHKISDLEEVTKEMCAAVLEDVKWMKETLHKKKDDFLTVQKMVSQNCQDCTSYVLDLKADLMNKINQIAGNLVQDITEQKDKTDSRINKAVANIDEKLTMAKDFEKIAKNKAVFEVETKRLVKFRSAKDEIQSRFSETTPYTILTFMKCADVSNSLSKLFGKLIQKNRQIGMKMGAAVSYKTDLDKTKENGAPVVSARTKATASTCSKQRSSSTEAISHQQKTPPMNEEMRRRVSGQIAKVGPLKDSAKMSTKLPPSTSTAPAPGVTHSNSLCLLKDRGEAHFHAAVNNIQQAKTVDSITQLRQNTISINKPANNSDHFGGPLSDMVRNTQLTVAVTQVRGSNTIPAGNIPQGLNTEVANNQLAENSTVYNQPPTSKVQPAVNATGFTPQTTNTWCNQMRNDMVVIHCSQNSIAGSRQELSNIPPYSQADCGIQPEHPSSNKESVESNSVFNQPSTNSMTTIQPATNTIAIRQPVDNNTGENVRGSKKIQISPLWRKYRRWRQ